jgi:hypothetical protein
MNQKQQAQQAQEAQQRQAFLETRYSKKELEKIQQYNPVLAQSALASAQLREAEIEPLSK